MACFFSFSFASSEGILPSCEIPSSAASCAHCPQAGYSLAIARQEGNLILPTTQSARLLMAWFPRLPMPRSAQLPRSFPKHVDGRTWQKGGSRCGRGSKKQWLRPKVTLGTERFQYRHIRVKETDNNIGQSVQFHSAPTVAIVGLHQVKLKLSML